MATKTLEQITTERQALEKQSAALELPVVEAALKDVLKLVDAKEGFAATAAALPPGMARQALENMVQNLVTCPSLLEHDIARLKGIIAS